MSVVRLVDGARDPQGVFRHLHMVVLQDSPLSGVHEPRVPEESIVIRGVALTIRKAPTHARHVQAKPPKGTQ